MEMPKRALRAFVGGLALVAMAASAAAIPPGPPLVVNDVALNAAVETARERFLARQPFKRFDVTVLQRNADGRWRRGSVGGAALAYPASVVKLPYLVAAVHWCAERGRAPDCLDADVRPMIVVSDNVATGRVVDAISGVANIESDADAGFYAWLERRRYTERLMASAGLLGQQRLLNKTWPTNSGEEPVGYEKLSIARVGRNAMAPDDAARLILAIEEGVLEPQATEYMKQLLQRERFGGHGSFGRGLPPGTDYRAKIGNAYDTLEEVAAFTLPDQRKFVIAAFSDGLNQEDPEPHDTGTLGSFVEELLALLPAPDGAPHIGWTGFESAEKAAPGWRRVLRTGARSPSGAVLESDVAGAEYTWRVRVPRPGQYEVAAWYPAAAGQTANATYTVAGDGTAADVVLDQQHWHARWLPLGVVDVRGEELVVSARNAGAGTLVADTLRVSVPVHQ
jgi:protein phosphatase methylesterase 1